MGLTPLRNLVTLRKVDGGNVTKSGIVVQRLDGIDKAEVIEKGPLCTVDTLKEGDVVLVDWTSAAKFYIDNKDLYLVNENAIQGIFTPDIELT